MADESRTLQATTIAAGIGFPHARLAIRVQRLRGGCGRQPPSSETVYAVTNLTWESATPAELADLIRGHWAIENKIHYVRDTTFDEDASQVRTSPHPPSWPPCATSPSASSAPATPARTSPPRPAPWADEPRHSSTCSTTLTSHQSQQHQLLN